MNDLKNLEESKIFLLLKYIILFGMAEEEQIGIQHLFRMPFP